MLEIKEQHKNDTYVSSFDILKVLVKQRFSQIRNLGNHSNKRSPRQQIRCINTNYTFKVQKHELLCRITQIKEEPWKSKVLQC